MSNLSPQQFSTDDYIALGKTAAEHHVEKLAEMNNITPRLMDTPLEHAGLEHHVIEGAQAGWSRAQAATVASRVTPSSLPIEEYRKVEAAVHQHGQAHAEKLGVPWKFQATGRPM